MGKRSTTSTKSGKFMNPTDQARKEARRKELKKNKKQRMAVRHAVLKGKDAQKILYDLDEVDDMEFNPSKVPMLAEKVLKEKRKKLIETFERVLKLYEKEEPDMYTEFKELFNEYLERKQRKQNYYEEVRSAERVLIDEIPLPDITVASSELLPTSDIPLPQTKSILKKSAPKPDGLGLRKPPGPPAGPPPLLSDSEDENDPKQPVVEKQSRVIRFADDGEVKGKSAVEAASQPIAKTPLQKAMLKFAAEEAAKSEAEKPEEGEEVFAEHGTSETQETPEENEMADDVDGERLPVSDKPRSFSTGTLLALGQPVLYAGPGGAPVLGLPAPTGHPGVLMRPQGIQLPPGPPPGLPPAMRMHRLPPGLPPRLAAPRMIPPGMMPLGMRPPMMSGQANVLSAPASIMKPPVNRAQKPKDGRTTISAKPQIKHTIGDVTRFVPAALKVKRNPQAKPTKPVNPSRPSSMGQRQPTSSTTQTKDDAYDTFLKEIEGIM